MSAHDIAAGGTIANRSKPASMNHPPAQPLIAPTGSPGVNSVLDVINSTAAPFMNAPPAEQGAAGAVAQGLGGVLGLVGAPAMIIDTAFASLTAPIAALFPSMPAITLLGMHVGVPHAHTHPPSLVPPAPPVPLPSIGMLVGSGSIAVLIGGLPAARAGDIGISVTCGSLAPPFEVFTGSSNVFIGGARAARILDITKHCNPTAMGPFAIAMGAAGAVAGAAGAVATGSASAAAQVAADAAVLALKLLCGKDPGIPPGMGALVGPPVGNVLIGGFPCPPVGEMAVGALLKAIKAVGRAIKKRASRGANAHCADGSHPIYLVTGENFDSFVDFVSGGLFEWRRHYTSARSRIDSPLGHGWRHLYQRTLSVRLNKAVLTQWDGQRVEFPRFERGAETTRGEGHVLRRLGRGRYRVSYRREPVMEFVGNEFEGDLQLTKLYNDEHELSFSYDRQGRLCVADEFGKKTGERRRFEFGYDQRNHLVEVIEVPDGGPGAQVVSTATPRAAYNYVGSADLLEARDALEGRWSYEYDAFHRMIKQTDPRGYSYTFRYDAWGRCVEASGQDGLWACKVQYFADKKFTRYTEGDGATWEYHYEGDGFVHTIIDPYGGKKLRKRDPEGKVLCEVDSGGREICWLYDGSGAHYARVDQFGNLFPPEVDEPNPPNPFARTLPSTSLAWYFGGLVKVDAHAGLAGAARLPTPLPAHFGSLIKHALHMDEVSPRPAPLAETRDALGRRTSEQDSRGRRRQWAYDATGNLIATIDRDGRLVEQSTTSWNLLGERRTPVGQSLRYKYSSVEKVTEIADPLGNVSRYDYDLKERLIRVHRNGRVREEYVFDTGDHLLEKRDGEGNLLFRNIVHKASHFTGTRLLSNGGEHRYDYDARGRVTEASTDQHEVTLRYGLLSGRIADLRDGRGVEHADLGAGVRRTTLFGRFTVSQYTQGDGSSTISAPDGSWTLLRCDSSGVVLRECHNGTRELLRYDDEGRQLGRVVWRELFGGPTEPWTVRYEYSLEGDLLQVTDSMRGTTRFKVDEAHRLCAEETPDGKRLAYVLDAADNVLRKPGLDRIELATGNRLAASDTEAFEYNHRDHLSLRRDLLTGATTRYLYDSFDMLTRVEVTDAAGALDRSWTYEYDALGRRIAAKSEERQRQFFWDGDRLLGEIFPNGALRIYHYASPEALSPIQFTDYESVDADPRAGRSYHVFGDPTGMPLQIQDPEGEVVWQARRVDPYGGIFVEPNAQIEYNLRWPGHYYDPETELHYNRYRYYDPRLGRYLQSDPIGYEGSEINLYAYRPNPLVDVDILGLSHPNKTSKSSTSGGDNEGVEGPGPAKPKPPHADVPLNEMTKQQMQDVCSYHADNLAAIQEPRLGRRNANTFSVGVIEDSNGNRRLVATSSMDGKPSSKAQDYMAENNIKNESDVPPRLRREPVKNSDGSPKLDDKGKPVNQTVDKDTGQPYDKNTQTDHHAEQRMENVPKANDENVVAQSHSNTNGCCSGCQTKLSQPDSNGNRPIDNIPKDRQGW
jgi:RHS repeat-associated protein